MKEIFKKKNIDNISSFKEDIRKFAKENNLNFQETDDTEEISWVGQLKKDSKLTLGVTSRAITVKIEDFSEGTIKITVGEGKWVSKIAGSAVTMVASGPLFLLAGATTVTGIFKQVNLLNKIYNLIEINFD